MRQVPQKTENYLIVGNGKMARHLSCYFKLLGISFISWKRSSFENIEHKVSISKKILVAISDDAIEDFTIPLQKKFPEKIFIHFSGILTIPNVYSAHPLMTFGNNLYSLKTYKKIPFIIENKIKFKKIFPELQNNFISIEPGNKAIYHAWCSIAGNFTTSLWIAFFKRMKTIGIEKKLCLPYMEKTFENLVNQKSPLTGPLLRKDKHTIKNHKKSLSNDCFSYVYEAMEKAMKSEGQI